jgi:uncharacterized membrane protein
LLGDYNFGQLDLSYTIDKAYSGGSFQRSKKLSKRYFHVGESSRYYLTDSLYMSAEYILHNIGKMGDYDVNVFKHVKFNLKNHDIWQAGVSYTFKRHALCNDISQRRISKGGFYSPLEIFRALKQVVTVLESPQRGL